MAGCAVFPSSSPPRLDRHGHVSPSAWSKDVFAAPREPSSPAAFDADEGEEDSLSPSFDESFASVMSFTLADDRASHLNASLGSTTDGSVTDGMEISPAPVRKVYTEPGPLRPSYDNSIFGDHPVRGQSERHGPPSPPASPSSRKSGLSDSTSSLTKRRTLPAIVTNLKESRHRSVRSLGQSPTHDSVFLPIGPPSRGKDRRSSSGRPKSPLFGARANMPPPSALQKRHTDTEVPGRPALMRADHNLLPHSAPAVPTISSPCAMDVDPRSPDRGVDADLSALGEAFEVASPLPAFRAEPIISAVPASRKRSLCDQVSSPLSTGGRDSSPLRKPTMPRLFEQAIARRGAGQTGIGHGRRPSLSGQVASFHGAAGVGLAGIDEQQPLKRVRPAFPSRMSRRTQSSVDCSATAAAVELPRLPAGLGIGRPPQERISSLAVTQSGYFDIMPPANRAVSENHSKAPTAISPSLFAGEFAVNEHDGKALACHSVKDDGLMRITSKTLDDLVSGSYNALINDYVIIDCRFDYEYAGGHIDGAVNLQNEAAVEEYFLRRQDLPPPSRSGQADPSGVTRKLVVIFHCEFSAKRAPTMAKHLRSRDRALNTARYPAVHYPELYVLEGGYEGIYRNHPHVCNPRGYVRMDDPQHLVSRHSELNKFRQRQALAQRAKSFTFGERVASTSTLPQPPQRLPTVEDAAADTSFGSSDEGAGEGSPCPPAAKTVLLNKFLAPPRRPMARAVTTTRLL